MKLILLTISLMTILSCQDNMRSRRPLLPQSDPLNSKPTDNEITVKVTVDYALKDNTLEILTNDEEGDEDCFIALRAGKTIKHRIKDKTLTLFDGGKKIDFQLLSESHNGLIGIWGNTRKTRLMTIEEKMYFSSDDRLVIKKTCSKP